MHGLCCNSRIHHYVDPFLSSPVRLACSLQYRGYHTEYLLVNQASLSVLINSPSHGRGSTGPEADVHWQYFTTNHGAKIFISVLIFCIYMVRCCGQISLSGTGLCSAEGQMLPTQRQLCSASLRFLAWTYVGCRGLRLSQAVALLRASWCERIGSMWLVDKNRAVPCVCVHVWVWQTERERKEDKQSG